MSEKEFFIVFLLLVSSAYILVKVLDQVTDYIQSLPRRLKRRRMKRISQKLKAQTKFYFRANADKDTTAICVYSDFEHELNEHEVAVLQGRKKLWDKVTCIVPKTFTFARNSRTKRIIHAGTFLQFRRIGEEIIKMVTGESLNGLTARDIDELLSVVIVWDSRLFVPYSGNGGMTGDEQLRIFGAPTLADARKYLLGEVGSHP